MLDFAKIQEFEMKHVDIERQKAYEYEQIEDSLVTANNQTIRVGMKSKDNREDVKPFQIKITKENNEYRIVLGLFPDFRVPHLLDVYEGNNEFILTTRFNGEIIYIHVYYEE